MKSYIELNIDMEIIHHYTDEARKIEHAYALKKVNLLSKKFNFTSSMPKDNHAHMNDI